MLLLGLTFFAAYICSPRYGVFRKFFMRRHLHDESLARWQAARRSTRRTRPEARGKIAGKIGEKALVAGSVASGMLYEGMRFPTHFPRCALPFSRPPASSLPLRS